MSVEKMTILNQVLQKQFPSIKNNDNHLVFGSGGELINVIKGVFKDKTIKQVYSSETIKTPVFKVKLTPFIYNSYGVLCTFSTDKLNKFIKKVNKKIAKHTIDYDYYNMPKKHRRYYYHYFLCIKDDIVFLVTNDFDVLNEIRVQEDNGYFDDIGEYVFSVIEDRDYISNANSLLLDLMGYNGD